MEVDLTRVPRLAERQDYRKHHETMLPLYEERGAVSEPFEVELENLSVAYERECEALRESYQRNTNAVRSRQATALEEIELKIESHEPPEIEADIQFDEYGDPLFCAVSGVVLLDDDDTVEHPQTCETALACLLPWPQDGGSDTP